MARTIVRGPLDFVAADGTGIETLYSYFALIEGISAGYVGVKSNKLTQLFGAVAQRNVYRDGSGTYTADQYSGAIVSGLGGITFGYLGLTVRVSADTGANADFYLVRIQDVAASGSNQTTDVIKVVNGSASTLDTRNISWSNGNAVYFEAVDNGANVDLNVYQGTGSTPRYTVTDSSSPLASGKPGVYFEQGTTVQWDDMELGTIGGGGSSVFIPIIGRGPGMALAGGSGLVGRQRHAVRRSTWTRSPGGVLVSKHSGLGLSHVHR